MSINPNLSQTISGSNWYSGYSIGVRTAISAPFFQCPPEAFVFGNDAATHPTTGVFSDQYGKIRLPENCAFRVSRARISSNIPSQYQGFGVIEPDTYGKLHFAGSTIGIFSGSIDVPTDFHPKINVKVNNEYVFGENFPFLGKDIELDLNKYIFRSYSVSDILTMGAIYASMELIKLPAILLNVSLFCEIISDEDFDRIRKGC